MIDMPDLVVAQVVINPKRGGGVTTEFQSLMESNFNKKISFIPIILPLAHKGLNVKDIRYYYHELKRNNYDIVHIRGAGIDSLNAIIAAKLLKKGKIYTVVHGLYSEMIYINRFKKFIHKHVTEKVIFLLSDYVSFLYKNHKYELNIPKSKILTNVYNMYPKMDDYDKNSIKKLREQFNIHENDFVVLYVGRLTREKGLEFYCDAILSEELKKISNIKFMFVGDGPYKNQISNLLLDQVQSNRVILVGNKEKVSQYYYLSNIFINPSLHENHSISILEAIKTKTPVIVTDVGGNSETVIEKQYGIVIPPFSTQEIKKSILSMFDKDTYLKYKSNMNEIDHRFTSSEIQKTLINNYINIERLKNAK